MEPNQIFRIVSQSKRADHSRTGSHRRMVDEEIQIASFSNEKISKISKISKILKILKTLKEELVASSPGDSGNLLSY